MCQQKFHDTFTLYLNRGEFTEVPPHPSSSARSKFGLLTRHPNEPHAPIRILSTSDLVITPLSKEGDEGIAGRLAANLACRMSASSVRFRSRERVYRDENVEQRSEGQGLPQRKHTLICCSETSLGCKKLANVIFIMSAESEILPGC